MPILLLLIALMQPAAAWAQSSPLGIDAGTGARPVEIERVAGNAVFALTALQPLGAKIESDARGARVRIFDQTLAFEYGSPFFKAGKDVFQLVAPVQKDGLVSTQLLTEWLPKRFPEKLAFKNGTLRAKRFAHPRRHRHPRRNLPPTARGQLRPRPRRARASSSSIPVMAAKIPAKSGRTGCRRKP